MTYVTMWIRADFLQVESLQVEVSMRLPRKLADAFHDLYTFRPLYNNPKGDHRHLEHWLNNERNLILFFSDLYRATSLIYGVSVAAARKPQLALSTFVLAIRERMPEEQLCSLSKDIPSFAADIHRALVNMHFVYGRLGDVYGPRASMRTYLPTLSYDAIMDAGQKCRKCEGMLLSTDEYFKTHKNWISFSPWDLGVFKWCNDHGLEGLESAFKDITNSLLKEEENEKIQNGNE